MYVDAKVVGRPAGGVPTREIPYAPADPVPLRLLIDHVVREEVSAFSDRERRRRFIRVLSPQEIDHGVAAGKLDPASHLPGLPIDPDAAVATAVEAFEDGLYFVFLDSVQLENLDQPVQIRPESRVQFFRLTPLAGG